MGALIAIGAGIAVLTGIGAGVGIGIATGKLHARGPVGVEQLVSFKYKVRGNGQIRGI